MHHEIRKSDDGQFYVVEIADNGEILNTSETFTTKKAAIKNAAVASGTDGQIVDATVEGDAAA